MLRFLMRILGIKRGEGRFTAWMFIYVFLLIASLMIFKPVSTSLFLRHLGAEALPYVYMLVALISVLITPVYSKLSRVISLNRLIHSTFILSITSLIVIWFILQTDYSASWFLYFFYTLVSLLSIIITSQFWLLASYVVDARQAKRLFGTIGAGGIAGGIFGGYLTRFLAPLPGIGTVNLIWACILFLIICEVLASLLWRYYAQGKFRERMRQFSRKSREETKESNPLSIILRSRHLLFLSLMVGISVLVAKMVDYSFNAVAVHANQGDDLTAFLGFWMSNLSVLSLLIQLVVTGRVLKHAGVITSLFFLPLGILAGAAAVFLFPQSLTAAVLMKVSDGGFKQSIHKSGMELLTLPIPAKSKNQTKAFIDVTVDSIATGISGVLLIAITAFSGVPLQIISVVVAIMILVWIVLIYLTRPEYINSFRQALEKRSIQLDVETVNLQDATVLKSITNVLEGTNERQILFILDLIENSPNSVFAPYLENLLEFPSDAVQLKTLQVLAAYPSSDVTDKISHMVTSDYAELRIESIRYTCLRAENQLETFTGFFYNEDLKIASAAILAFAREKKENASLHHMLDLNYVLETVFKGQSETANEEEKRIIMVCAAQTIGLDYSSVYAEYLFQLLKSDDTDTLRESIISAGTTHDPQFIPALIHHLKTRNVRRYARQALAEYGDAILPELSAMMKNDEVDLIVRLEIPKILTLIGTQKVVDELIASIGAVQYKVKYAIYSALHDLKRQYALLKFNTRLIEKTVQDEISEYYALKAYLYTLDNENNIEMMSNDEKSSLFLLMKTLREMSDECFHQVFTLLGIRYSPTDLNNVYFALKSNDSEKRANAFEYLDNVANNRIKNILFPILEEKTLEQLIATMNSNIPVHIPNVEDSLQGILSGKNDWLKVCALFYIAECKHEAYRDSAKQLYKSKDRLVRETAQFAMAKLDTVPS